MTAGTEEKAATRETAGPGADDGERHVRPAGAGSAVRRRGVDLALGLVLALLALAFVVPVAESLLAFFSDLTTPGLDPNPNLFNDAEALYLGQPLYQDPAAGYTGIIYTPFLPAVVALLLRVSFWPGWQLLLGGLAVAGLAAVGARLAWTGRRSGPFGTALAVVEALGLGTLGIVLVHAIQRNGLLTGDTDQPAWAFAVLGLVTLPAAAARRSPWRLAAAALLLTAAVWSRQNTLIAPVGAVVWIGLEAAVRRLPWRVALGFAGGLAGLNLAVLGAVAAATAGWSFEFNVLIPSRHPVGDLGASFSEVLTSFSVDLLGSIGFAFVFVGLIWGAVAWSRFGLTGVIVRGVRDARRGGERPSRLARSATALGLVGVLGSIVATAGLAQAVSGGRSVPLGWALALLGFTAVTALALPLWIAAVVRAWRRPARPRHALLLAGALAVGAGVGAYRYSAGAQVGFPSLGLLWPALLVAAAGGLAFTVAHLLVRAARVAATHGATPPPASEPRTVGAERIAAVLAVFLIVGIVLSVYTRNKEGADDHYYIGMAWALAFLGAIGYRFARRRPATSLVAGAAVALVLVGALVGPATGGGVQLPSLAPLDDAEADRTKWLTLWLPSFDLHSGAGPESRELVDYARTHSVYDMRHGDLSLRTTGALYPGFENWYGMVAGGRQPLYLVNAILGRRIDAVAPLDPGSWDDGFASGHGRWEENWNWKLDQVIRARYTRPPSSTTGEDTSDLLVRRRGPERSPWMRGCFGPFEVAGASFRINHGGGFWCRPRGAPEVLELRGTPAPWSDVRSNEPVNGLAGSLGASAPGPAGSSFEVALEPQDGPRWRLRGVRTGGAGLRLTALDGNRPSGTVTLPRGAQRAQLALEPDRPGDPAVRPTGAAAARVAVPGLGEGAVLRLGGTRESRVRFDLGRLRLG